MRILTWCYSFWPGRGGLERILPQISLGLAERGHEILVVTQTVTEAQTQHAPLFLDHGPSEAWWDRLGPLRIHRAAITTCMDANDARGLARLTAEVRAVRRSFDADVVHHALGGRDTIVALSTDDAPCVVSNHLSIAHHQLSDTSALARAFTRAARVLVVSESARRETAGLLPGLAERLSVAWNGVAPTPGPVPVPEGAPVILAHGRLVPEKGFATLLLAFALLLEDHPEVRLVLAGDGYGRTGLEYLAGALGLAERVTFTGWVDDVGVRALIDASTVVAVPSNWNEPFGLTALEASERARPVVASLIGGLAEIVVHGETGLLVQAGDPLSLAAALEAIIVDPSLATEMGTAGRRRAHREFTLERCIDRYERALLEAAR